MRAAALSSILVLVACSSRQTFAQATPSIVVTPQFSSDERQKIIDYWAQTDRYTTTVPDNASEKGLWQVRLTVEGSTWLWNLNKGKKTIGLLTVDASPSPEDQKAWDSWVSARIARDRWEAWQIAVRANGRILGKELPAADSATPTSEPVSPGPIPSSLFAVAGNPPRFARAVVPMVHQVKFDDDSITYQDNYRVGNQRYPYYRFSQGVGSEGTAVKTIPPDRLVHLFHLADISDSEARIMKSVSILEGGFDAVNTYDTGFVSVGFIQFACLREGGGSMGAMLLAYKTANSDQFQKDFRDFGIDVSPTGLLIVVDPATGAEIFGTEAANRIIEDKRLIAVFQRAGHKSDPYVSSQIRSAKGLYFPADDPISISVDGQMLSGKVSDFIKSEAGLATLMDRKVNTGNLNPLPTVVSQIAAEMHPQTISDLSKYEYDIVARLKYRKDYLADPSLTQPTPASDRPHRSFSQMSRSSQGRNGRRSSSLRVSKP